MKLKHVDIYITHNVRGFRTEHGTYGYTLAFRNKEGELRKIEDYARGYAEQHCTDSIGESLGADA